MPKTDELPGVEGPGVAPKKIKRLDNAIDNWRSAVTERMELTEKEIITRDKVVAIMHEEGLHAYRYYDSDDEPKDLVLDSTEKLKLKKVKTASDDSGEAEEND